MTSSRSRSMANHLTCGGLVERDTLAPVQWMDWQWMDWQGMGGHGMSRQRMGLRSWNQRGAHPRRVGVTPWLALWLLTGCGSVNPIVGTPGLDAARKVATIAIDQARCETERARLRPFTVGWDATNLAELGGHITSSIAFFRLQGCDLELLPQCRLPGTYTQRAVPASDQTVKITSQEELYLRAPLSVAALSASLARHGSLMLDFTVRSMRYATAPALFRSQLPAGCEEVTHFAVNYAEGAYALNTSAASGAEMGMKAFGVGASAGNQSTSSTLFRGGTLAQCRQEGTGCDAPVRLRLTPIRGGAPPAAIGAASRLAATKPTPKTTVRPALELTSIEQTIRLGRVAWVDCLAAEVEEGDKWPVVLASPSSDKPEKIIRVKVKLTVNPDGTVSNVESIEVTEGTPEAFLGCFRGVFRSLRFEPPAGGGTVVIKYPVVFKPGPPPSGDRIAPGI